MDANEGKEIKQADSEEFNWMPLVTFPLVSDCFSHDSFQL